MNMEVLRFLSRGLCFLFLFFGEVKSLFIARRSSFPCDVLVSAVLTEFSTVGSGRCGSVRLSATARFVKVLGVETSCRACLPALLAC